MYTVYQLADPRDSFVKYIGITKDLKKRTSQHMLGNYDNKMVWDWIREMRSLGLKPTVQVIETCEDMNKASDAEVFWIKYYANYSDCLLNVIRRKHYWVKRAKAKHLPTHSNEISPGEIMLDLSEASSFLGRPIHEVKELIKSDKIIYYRFSNSYRFYRSDLEELMST